jgi:hypothetical protein
VNGSFVPQRKPREISGDHTNANERSVIAYIVGESVQRGRGRTAVETF